MLGSIAAVVVSKTPAKGVYLFICKLLVATRVPLDGILLLKLAARLQLFHQYLKVVYFHCHFAIISFIFHEDETFGVLIWRIVSGQYPNDHKTVLMRIHTFREKK